VQAGKEKLTHYAVLVATADKKEIEVEILANGKITSAEVQKPEK
jgi:hypothetical protein